MGKIKQGLLGLASMILAASVSAGEAKAPHKDYVSLGPVVESVSDGATIDTLANDNDRLGLNVSRRLSLNNDYGILFSVTAGPTRDYPRGWLQTNCDFSAMRGNFEVYVGPGLMLEKITAPYFAPHFGARYHFLEGNGLYIGAEFGPLINPEKAGMQGNVGVGVRFDIPPNRE